MVNTNGVNELKEDLMNIVSEMYNKGAISGLELIKEYISLDKNVTVESILTICDLHIDSIK